MSKVTMNDFVPTEKTTVRRKLDRRSYDREWVYRILDETFVCQVAFIDNGLPFVVPNNYGRVGDKACLHGPTASRLILTLRSGVPCRLHLTLVDVLVRAPIAAA